MIFKLFSKKTFLIPGILLLLALVFVLSQIVLAKNGTGNFQIKDSYIEIQETNYPEYIPLVKKENGKEEVAGQVKIVDQYLISEIPENEFLEEYSYLKEGFQDLTISLETDEPLFAKENFYHPPSLFEKTKSLFGFETLPEYRITKEIDKTASIQTELDLRKLKIETHYEELGIENNELRIKQTLTFTNNSGQDLNLSLLLKNKIEAERIQWNNHIYSISETPRKIGNPAKISFYSQNMKYLSFYDFSDIPDEFKPELWIEVTPLDSEDYLTGQALLILSLSVSLSVGETKTIDPNYNTEITPQAIVEKDGTYSFKSLEGDVVEIGVKEHSPPIPYAKLNKWDGEVSVSLSFPTEAQENLQLEGNKVKWVENKREVHFYPLEPRTITENGHTFKQLEQGGFEFEVFLKERPASNKVVLNIETKGLKFYYQPELTQEEIEEGCICPDNVVGSYAVYHATRTNMHRSKQDAEKYKCGKAFHIYRPKITDADGKWVWGELRLGEQADTLTTTIPQDFLNTAVYPVSTGTTNFGYEDEGALNIDIYGANISYAVGSIFSLTETGTLQSITAFIRWNKATARARFGIYNDSLEKIDQTEESDHGGTGLWAVEELLLNFATPFSRDAGSYWLVAIGRDETTFSVQIRYDTNGTDQEMYKSLGETTTTLPDTIVDPSYEDKICSIYCTYEPANTAPTVSTITDDSTSASPTNVGSNVTFSGTIIDPDDTDLVRLAICKTDEINASSQCTGGAWCYDPSSTTWRAEGAAECSYTTLSGDESSNDWYAYACDDDNACTNMDEEIAEGTVGTFYVNHEPEAEAGVVDEQVDASSDDVHYYGASGWSLTFGVLRFRSIITQCHGAMRFENIAIPSGATIGVSYLELYRSSSSGDAPTIYFYCEEHASPATFSTRENFDGRSWTTDYASWVATSDAGWNDTDSLNTPIQELIDDVGEITALVIKGQTQGVGNSDFQYYSYDGNSSYATKLHIEYTTAYSDADTAPGKNVGQDITFTMSFTDSDSDTAKIHVCKTDAITSETCDEGSWCDGSSYGTSPQTCTHTAAVGDGTSNSYYVFACDEHGFCDSTSVSGTFYVNHAPNFTAVDDAPDPLNPGVQVNITTTASDATDSDDVKLFVCKTASCNGSSCTEGEWCSAGLTTSNPTCYFNAPIPSEGAQHYYPYIYDEHGFGAE